MIDRSNYVFTQVITALGTKIKGYGQGDYNPGPAELPYFQFKMIDNAETASDLSGNENAANMTVELTIYATGALGLNTCKSLMVIADTSMRSMGFRRMFGPQQITNAADANICRYLARYNRIIGSGDTL